MTLLIREHSSSSYAPRTWANATEAGLTVVLAVDHTTAGEKLTKKASGEKFVELCHWDTDYVTAARIIWRRIKAIEYPTINVAGNDIYTLAKNGYTQEQINQRVYDILKLVHEHHPIRKVISGGQTGTDLAGGYAGWKLGIDTVLTLPKGFLQRHEDGVDRKHTMEEIWEQVTGQKYEAR